MNAAALSPLVSTQWLQDQLHNPNVVVLDASIYLEEAVSGAQSGQFRSGLDAYASEGHIPGARFADLFTQFSDPSSALPFTRPTVRQFESAAGRLGIGRETHVVIYDSLVGQWASRLWWVFRSFGHPAVSVLNGGLRKYLKEGRVLEKVFPSYTQTRYKQQGPNEFFAQKADVLDIVENRKSGQLICFLEPDDYAGMVSVRSRPGHIVKSVNLPFTKLVDRQTNTVLPPEQLEPLFSAVARLDGTPIITYCGGGVASTLGSLALATLGYRATAEYDGSLVEWSLDPELPLVTGL